MRIISWNVNGIRSACRKGLLDSLKAVDPDIICLQEIKAQEDQFPGDLKVFREYSYFNCARKKGYSGVSVLSRVRPERVEYSFGAERFDSEGRVLILYFKDIILMNIYMPHGGRQKENLDYKLSVYDRLQDFLGNNKDRNVIIAGDFNIAHQDIDVERYMQNRNNIMFTEEERARISRMIGSGYIDSFRLYNDESGNYTWWPYAFDARERNVGWRIDYIFISRQLKQEVRDAFILDGINGSDHCPIGIELDGSISFF